jgi:hypothetical protein
MSDFGTATLKNVVSSNLWFIKLTHGVPSHDTIQRVMGSIKPVLFSRLLETWQKMLNNHEGEKLKQILAIDGKTIRGNGN